VNLWALSIVFIIEYLSYVLLVGEPQFLWVPITAAALTLVASHEANKAAIEWGSLVKAAFDTFLPQLRTKLQLPFPPNVDTERQQWNEFSKAILYTEPKNVQDRDPSYQQHDDGSEA
jgi:hypothetical protein